MKMPAFVLSGLALAGTLFSASAAPIDASYSTPTLDRWVYTFGGNAGFEQEATVFSILGSGYETVFDIRDGQFLVGFDTSLQVSPGQGAVRYRILEASLTATISRDKVFRYDPTPDPLGVYFPSTDPRYVPDSDPDHPVEIYAVGYRGGLTSASFMEATAFSFVNPVQKSVRNGFAAQYQSAEGTGSLVDVSNNVIDLPGSPAFDTRPLAIGLTPLAPGALVDVDTTYTFTLDPANPETLRYLRESLDSGRINLMISSLTLTSQQASTTPAFYTREYPAAIGGVPAALHVRVCVGAPADWNCSGDSTVQDIFDFLSDYFASRGDFNSDGATSVQDIFDFLSAYFAG